MNFSKKIYQLLFSDNKKLIPTYSKKKEIEMIEDKQTDKDIEVETDIVPVNESLHNHQQLTSTKIIKSEVNFKRWPYFSLSRQGVKEIPKPYEDTIKTRGGELKIFWKVVTTSEYGCPSPFDKKIYGAIEQIINEIGWPVQKLIPFSFYQLCKILGVKISGWIVKDIKNSLRRMVLTGIDTKGAFYRKEKRQYLSEKIFHLYNGVYFKEEDLPNGSIAETNYIELGQFYLESLNAHYIKPIDFNFYQELKNPIPCRLFEILGLQFYGLNGQPAKFEYQKLCTLLPITPQKYFSEAKRKLQPAHNKLIEKKYLKQVEWIQRNKKYWEVIYYPSSDTIKKIFAEKKQEPIEIKAEPATPKLEKPREPEKPKQELKEKVSSQKQEAQQKTEDPLILELTKRDITKSQAPKKISEYKKKYPDGDLLDVLECFDHKNKQGAFERIDNKAGLLITFLQDNICQAEGYTPRAKRKKVIQEKQKIEQHLQAQDKKATQESKTKWQALKNPEAKFDFWWSSFTLMYRKKINQVSDSFLDLIKSSVKKEIQNNPDNIPPYREFGNIIDQQIPKPPLETNS